MSTAVAVVRAQPDKCKMDFDAVVVFLTQYIDKKAPTPSLKVAYVTQTRHAKRQKTSASHGTFRGKIELKSTPEKSMAQFQLPNASSFMNLRRKQCS